MGSNVSQPMRVIGYSGSTIQPATVRKIAKSANCNERLLEEYRKMTWLWSLGYEMRMFSVPTLFNYEIGSDGRAFYELGYIDGKPLDDVSEMVPLVQEMGKIRHHNSISASKYLLQKLGKWSRDVDIPEHDHSSMCHGDLTPDNVIVFDNGDWASKYYLIDALPNLHETYLWDAAKLMQTAYGWEYIRTGKFAVDGDKVFLPCDPYTDGHQAVAQSFYPELLAIYSLAVYARIIPYARSIFEHVALSVITKELHRRCVVGDYCNEPLASLRWPIE